MVSRVATVAFKGMEAVPVDVQVHMASGVVAFSIVGLGDKAVAESKERVRAALSAIGLALPARRITVNLAPADLPKEGSHYDLPIAIGLMAAMGLLPADFTSRYVVLGELSLDGKVEPVIRQTLHEWLRETSWDTPQFLCVCSDKSVAKGADDIIVQQSDLDFPVTTDAGEAREFLSREVNCVQVVFTTYQSSRVVGEAMEGLPAFDLGIFDEAHKTAGRESTNFAFALRDENLRIGKRVFLTATPRHYDVRKKDKEGDLTTVFSMDDEDT